MAELEINSNHELQEKIDELTKDSSINKPTEEEIAKAKEDFENAKKEFETTIYQIGEITEAQDICNYIKHFIRNRFTWQKDAWMGIIKLNEELDAAETLFKGNKEKGLELGYQALEFTYYILTNPCGVGLQAALDFESENENYVKCTISIAKQTEIARKKLKDIEFLREVWGAACQGFYLEKDEILDESEDTNEEEKQSE